MVVFVFFCLLELDAFFNISINWVLKCVKYWFKSNIQIYCISFSNKISYELYTRLLQTFEAHYCQIVDNQEPAGQGMQGCNCINPDFCHIFKHIS